MHFDLKYEVWLQQTETRQFESYRNWVNAKKKYSQEANHVQSASNQT